MRPRTSGLSPSDGHAGPPLPPAGVHTDARLEAQAPERPCLFGRPFGPNIALTGDPAPVRACIDELLPAVPDGTVGPGRVLDRTVSLDEVPEGYRAMARHETLRVLVVP